MKVVTSTPKVTLTDNECQSIYDMQRTIDGLLAQATEDPGITQHIDIRFIQNLKHASDNIRDALKFIVIP